ncbi:Transposase, Ptta/En/Spm, plant [Corchorus olitorius]|uniref:Transposase, Ptta/En/Spm, plant n=1 Tax=Corchorus olitorius TaxID=93759 RepID=A0A1R3J355_9ROSI|nr:Transposase, Ptta/En/Spm, plant [Corchorus olitorius]
MVEIWELDKEDNVVVKVNVHHLPVGDAACKLTRFFGTVEKFVFQKLGSDEFIDEEEMEHIKAWALEDMSCKWRAWKNELNSKYFDEDKTPAEMVKDVNDPRAEKISFWSLLHIGLLIKQRENQSKSDQPHCAGMKSFPRLIQTMTEEANGNHPSRADVYIRSRTRKDGNIVNEKAIEVVDRIKQIRIETPDDSLASWDKDVYSKENGLEKKGRVEGLRTEVHGLKNAVSLLLGAFQRHFPDESEEIMNAVQRVVNGEAPDATSAPEISLIRNNRSSESTHQPSQHQEQQCWKMLENLGLGC